MRSDQIEFPAEIGQRLPGIDSRDNAAHTEKLRGPAEERFVIGIESQAFVTEQTTQIEKISGAAAEIEYVERPRSIKPEILDTFYVNGHPVVRVLVRIDLSRIGPVGIVFAQPNQLGLVNRRENLSGTYRMRPSAGMLPQTFDRIAGKEFLNFL